MTAVLEAAAVKATVPPTVEAIKLTFGFLCTRGDYFCELEDNLCSFKNELDRLENLVKYIQSKINQADLCRMQKIYQVNDWFSRVDFFLIESLQVILDAEEEIRNKCIRFLCPKNCCSCSRIGIRVSNKLQSVKELLNDGDFTEVVERIPNSENGWTSTATNFVLNCTQRLIRVVGLKETDVQP